MTTSYNYDRVGNRINTTDAASPSRIVTATYDVLNRLTDEYDALGNRWQSAYDGLGRATTRLDAESRTTLYSYDNASRMVRMATANTITTTFGYNDGGQVTRMADTSPSQNTDYAYDGLNRLISVSSPQGVVQYGYDTLSRRSLLKFGPNTSNLNQVSYSYDGLSRPYTITNWASQPLTYTYDGTRLSQLSYPNGVNATYSFDGAERLTSIAQTKASTTIFSVTYTLDALINHAWNFNSRLSSS